MNTHSRLGSLMRLLLMSTVIAAVGCNDVADNSTQTQIEPATAEKTELQAELNPELQPMPQPKGPFVLDFAISLYASSLKDEKKLDSAGSGQVLNKPQVRQIARDYLAAWDTHEIASIQQKLQPVFAETGSYSDPGETAHGLVELSKTISGMHEKLRGLIRVFEIQGEPELIENTTGLYYNVENLLVYNWDWKQDGETVLSGKEFTLFNDDQLIKYDMGIFATEMFPHFHGIPQESRESMTASVGDYLSQINDLSGQEKFLLIEAAMTHPASIQNGSHEQRLQTLSSETLDSANFEISGKPSFTLMSIAYPWNLTLGDEVLLKGVEINVFDDAGQIKYAFGISGK